MLIDWSLDQPIEPSRVPVGLLSRKQAVEELGRRQRRQAMDAGYEAELILRLAEQSPDDGDPAPGTPGARRPGWSAARDVVGVSEFFASELALVLNRGRGTAHHLHHRAVVWRDNLPATFRSLSAGDLAGHLAVRQFSLDPIARMKLVFFPDNFPTPSARHGKPPPQYATIAHRLQLPVRRQDALAGKIQTMARMHRSKPGPEAG